MEDQFLSIRLESNEKFNKKQWRKREKHLYRYLHRIVFSIDSDIIQEIAFVVEIHQIWSSRLHHVSVLKSDKIVYKVATCNIIS